MFNLCLLSIFFISFFLRSNICSGHCSESKFEDACMLISWPLTIITGILLITQLLGITTYT